MKKIRIVEGVSASVLEANANSVLSEINSDEVEIRYMLDINKIVIEYIEKVQKLMCMDCRHYDTTQCVAKAFGICQCRGERVRFSHEICEDFEDMRG